MKNADAFRLTGTRKTEPPARVLRAGLLTAELLQDGLRTIRYGGVEVIRSISYLVRDRDWGTHSPSITGLAVEEAEGRFQVRYRARYGSPSASELVVDVFIEGSEERVVFRAMAISPSGFETNRCGFCILHPIVGISGQWARVEHVDGTIENTRFPDLIDPWQPFKDMRAISHEVLPGVLAECRMEGDIFEMEDQRNWSDASYKTYVRPLAMPWPYHLRAGEAFEQTITLSLTDKRTNRLAVRQNSDANIVELALGDALHQVPSIGVVITPEEAKASRAALASLADDRRPQLLLFHFDPLAGHDEEAIADFASMAAMHRGETAIEIALPCRLSPAEECRGIAAVLERCGFRPGSIMISPAVDRQSTPPGSRWPECPPLQQVYAAAHEAFGSIPIGGGMLSYFTELNRKRVPAETLSYISHATNPIVHAADDLSVMQTLEALPFITRSVRAIYGSKPYRLGPSTIAMRQNPYGSRTMDNPDGERVPMANRDPRHNAAFGAAFALGYAAAVLPAGPSHLTLSSLTGPFGLFAGPGEPVAEGGMRPLAEPILTLARQPGRIARLLEDPAGGRVVGMRIENPHGKQLLLANLSPVEQDVRLPQAPQGLLRRIGGYGLLLESVA